jgi:hypothetical protein
MAGSDQNIMKIFAGDFFLLRLKSYRDLVVELVKSPKQAQYPKTFETLTTALETYVIGVTVAYLLYIPFIIDTDLNKKKFLVYVLVQFVPSAAALHAGMKIAGGKGSWRASTAAYMYFMGLFCPLLVLLHYPLFLDGVIITDFIADNFATQLFEFKVRNASFAIQRYYDWAVQPLMTLLVLLFLYRWLGRCHSVGYWRVAVGVTPLLSALGAVSDKMIPYMQRFSSYMVKFLDKLF